MSKAFRVEIAHVSCSGYICVLIALVLHVLMVVLIPRGRRCADGFGSQYVLVTVDILLKRIYGTWALVIHLGLNFKRKIYGTVPLYLSFWLTGVI